MKELKKEKKIIIIDDEQSSRNLLTEYLKDLPHLNLIATCNNGFEAVDAINTHKPFMIFLDIEMPGKNGFEVLKELTFIPHVIFTTAYDEYALKAFEVNAIDYLLKPYTRSRFLQAINKSVNNNFSTGESITNLVQTGTSQKYPERLFAVFGNQLVNVQMDDVIWIEADGDYTRIHVKDQFYISGYSMNELEKKLDPSKFIRIHRSSIISLSQISTISNATSMETVIMKSGSEISVSRSYLKNFKAVITS